MADRQNIAVNPVGSLKSMSLVIDDAHVHVFSIFSYLRDLLVSVDSYVIEDVPIEANKEIIDWRQSYLRSKCMVSKVVSTGLATLLAWPAITRNNRVLAASRAVLGVRRTHCGW